MSCWYSLPGLARLEVGNERDDTGDSPPALDRPVKPALSTRGRGLPVCAFQGSPGVSRGPFSLFLFSIYTLTRTHKDQLSLTAVLFFFLISDYFIYLFLAAPGLRGYLWTFCSCSVRASRGGGFSCCGTQALDCVGFSSCGIWA